VTAPALFSSKKDIFYLLHYIGCVEKMSKGFSHTKALFSRGFLG
jgi:hypothetical protein